MEKKSQAKRVAEWLKRHEPQGPVDVIASEELRHYLRASRDLMGAGGKPMTAREMAARGISSAATGQDLSDLGSETAAE